MDSAALTELAERGLAVLRLSKTKWRALEAKRNGLTKFSLTFSHRVAHEAKRFSIVLITNDDDSERLRLGVVRSVQSVSSLESRVGLDLVRPINPRRLRKLLALVDEPRWQRYLEPLRSTKRRLRAASSGVAARLIEALAQDASNDALLRRLHAFGNKPKSYRDALALQHDAVALAIRAFGGDGTATSLSFGEATTALASVRLYEDAVIEHDARWIPGWKQIGSEPTGHATFKRDESKLDVFTANKRPLEELFGVDLIYLHRDRGSIVMLQYKMLERVPPRRREPDEEEDDWAVSVNDQFNSELDRMKRFDRGTDPEGAYRLHPGAFYLKFVRRNAPTKNAGFILSLDHVNALVADGLPKQKRGALRLSFDRLNGHYLRGEVFVDLVHSGYIGTRGSATHHLRSLIEATLAGGHAVVVAIESALPAG